MVHPPPNDVMSQYTSKKLPSPSPSGSIQYIPSPRLEPFSRMSRQLVPKSIYKTKIMIYLNYRHLNCKRYVPILIRLITGIGVTKSVTKNSYDRGSRFELKVVKLMIRGG